jgi:hypothetical protein
MAAQWNKIVSVLLENGDADKIKKVILAAFSASRKKEGATQKELKDELISVVPKVDDWVELLQGAYDVAVGKIDADTAAERLMDRVAVRTVVLLDKAIEGGIRTVDRLCDAMADKYPQTSPIADKIKDFVQELSPDLKKLVDEEIPKLVEKAKPFVAKALKVGREKLNELKEKGFEILMEMVL